MSYHYSVNICHVIEAFGVTLLASCHVIIGYVLLQSLMNVSLGLLGALSVAAVAVLIQYQRHFYLLYIGVVFLGYVCGVAR